MLNKYKRPFTITKRPPNYYTLSSVDYSSGTAHLLALMVAYNQVEACIHYFFMSPLYKRLAWVYSPGSLSYTLALPFTIWADSLW